MELWGTAFAYVGGGILLVAALVLFARPLRYLMKILLRSAIGVLGISVFNAIGSLFGVSLGVNMITALTTGILGFPGFALLITLYYLFP